MKALIKERIPVLVIVLVLLITAVCLAFTTFDTDKPADTESPTLGAQEIRLLKTMIQERQNVDHYWPIDVNNQVDHADVGEHRQVTFNADITAPASANRILHTILDGAASELAYDDAAAANVQITKAGALNLQGTYAQAMALTSTANTINGDVIACTSGGYLTLPIDTTDTTEGNLRYVNTGDTLAYRSASAWLELVTTSTTGQFVTGSYAGDGAGTKAVTGVGFEPEIVLILPGANSFDTSIKTSDMATTYAKVFSAGSVYADDAIRSLDADGFTVGDGTGGVTGTGDNMNDGSTTYFYICIDIL